MVPNITIETTGVCVRGWTWDSPRNNSPSAAIAYTARGIENNPPKVHTFNKKFSKEPFHEQFSVSAEFTINNISLWQFITLN